MGCSKSIVQQICGKAAPPLPAPLYRASDISRITPCEYEADKARLAECDVIIEVVAEVLNIKTKGFTSVAEHRKPGG